MAPVNHAADALTAAPVILIAMRRSMTILVSNLKQIMIAKVIAYPQIAREYVVVTPSATFAVYVKAIAPHVQEAIVQVDKNRTVWASAVGKLVRTYVVCVMETDQHAMGVVNDTMRVVFARVMERPVRAPPADVAIHVHLD